MKYFLFLDYDGTLTPIVKTPQQAVLSKTRRAALSKIALAPHITLAVISGRMISDLKKRVGLKGIYYAGNHGFEIQGPRVNITHRKALSAKPLLRKIKAELKKSLKGIRGMIIEDKILTLSLHYRLVKARDFRTICRLFPKIVAPYKKTNKIRITHGKKVFEIRPNIAWDKGKAVLWFLKKIAKKSKAIPVYIGDDTTDEDAFKVLKRKGVTIRVGKTRKTHAQQHLRNVNAVYKFLESLVKIC
jgi:alpha,alpha-trehalase